MPAPSKGKRLGGSAAHQKHILSNLATSLFEHGAITTTEAKARRLRPYAEKLISKAKRGDLHNRRQVMRVIKDKTVVHILFTEIGPRYENRPGGYTRITKLGPRKGDNAPMAVIGLVEAEFTSKARATKKATTAKKAAPAQPAPVDESTVDESTVDETAADTAAVDDSAAAEAEQVEAQDAVAEQESQDESPVAPADEAPADEAPADEAVAAAEDDDAEQK